jgi:tetratricopeptide (TPR) repeat protein
MEYFASSRGAWVSAIAGIGLMILLLNLKSFTGLQSLGQRLRSLITTKTMVRLGGLIVLGAAIGFVFLRQVQVTPGHGSAIGSGRFEIWANAFNVFLSSPIWGNGPYSMRILYAAEASLPPGFYAGNAHNTVLQILAELGVIGLALVSWLVLLVLRTFVRTWKSAPGSSYPRLAAYGAVFTAFTVHHMLDYTFELELLPYIIAILLFIAFLSHHAPETEKFDLKSSRATPIIAGLILVFIVGTVFTLRGSDQFQLGIDAANDGDWNAAEAQICAAYETSPHISHYAFQCALIQAKIAFLENDTDALEKSISMYEAGLQSDPYWPINWANLAALEWQSGERTNALTHMQQALDFAPRDAILALNTGWMMEQLGDEVGARDHYELTLKSNPGLIETVFFTQTNLRTRALADFVPGVIQTSAYSLAQAGMRAINDRNLNQAEEYLLGALSIDHNYADAYAWLARVHLELGDLDQAEYNISLALFLTDASPHVRMEASRIAQFKGNEAEAMDHLQRAYSLLRDKHHYMLHSLVFYMRPTLSFDLVPQLIDPKLNSFTVDSFQELAEYLKTSGDVDTARSVLEWIEVEID